MRIDPRELKMGDIFYECEYGQNIKARVSTIPKSKLISLLGEDKVQWSWQAVNVTTNAEISYATTEGYGHYGPSLYKTPQYVQFNADGEPEFKFS